MGLLQSSFRQVTDTVLQRISNEEAKSKLGRKVRDQNNYCLSVIVCLKCLCGHLI